MCVIAKVGGVRRCAELHIRVFGFKGSGDDSSIIAPGSHRRLHVSAVGPPRAAR